MAAERKRKGTFEEALRKLEQIVEHLEKGDVPLDDALRLYEEGIVLAKSCGERLNQAETSLKRLGKDVEGNLKLFAGEAEE